MTDSAQRPAVDSGRAGSGLLKGKLGLGDVLFQGITHIGPAVGVIFTLPFIVSYAGAAAPVALLGAAIIMLFIANTVAEFSRYMPSTGGYYSFVRRGLWLTFGDASACHGDIRTRLRSRSRLARPYICRLSILMRLT